MASELLAVGVESTDDNSATYLKVLFLLSRAMILMIERKPNDVLAILHQASTLIDNAISNTHLKEYLKVFFLVLQVCYYLSQGQVKTVKPSLKQLQQSIQTIMAANWPSDDGKCANKKLPVCLFSNQKVTFCSNIWSEYVRNVYLAAKGATLRTRISCDRIAFNDGRLYGQSTEVHREGSHANRQAESAREQTDSVRIPDHFAGAYCHVPFSNGQQVDGN